MMHCVDPIGSPRPLCIAFVADGDPENPMKSGSGSPARVIGALRRQGHVVHGIDASLKGWRRAYVAARLFRTNRRRWRARFWLNPLAFETRSGVAQRALESLRQRTAIDAVLMYGNDCLPVRDDSVPLFVYADNFSLHTQAIDHSNMAMLNAREQALAHGNELRVFAAARKIFTFSQFIGRKFAELAGIDARRIVPVYAGSSIDPSGYPEGRDGEANPRILFVGRDWSYKGGETLIAAADQLVTKVPGLKVVIAGVRHLPDDVRRRPYVEDLGVLDKTNASDAQRLSDAYATATLFVLPTEYDSFPIVILEAMFSGLPVITTNIWALPEMVLDGETGFVLAPRDVDGFRDRMLQLLRDRDVAARMGAAGRERAAEVFNWDAVANRIVGGITASLGGDRHARGLACR